MIISNPINNPVRTQDSLRSSPANERTLPQIASGSKAGQEFIPADPRVALPGQSSRAAEAPSSDNERIDLRVLNAAPVSRPEQRALNAYQSTAQLGADLARATFGVDEIA